MGCASPASRAAPLWHAPAVEWAHDLGGRTGLGTVDVEADEPVFHDPWERTARALVYATLMSTENPTTSGFRHGIERMEPEHYLDSSYYEHWLTCAATLAVEAGLVTHELLEERAGGRFPLSRPVQEVEVGDLGTGTERFAVGDHVRVSDAPTAGHTRRPSYVRGKVGRVTAVHGSFSLPDVEAHSTRRVHEGTYTVRFRAADLWPDGDASAVVHVDLWDSYLEGA